VHFLMDILLHLAQREGLIGSYVLNCNYPSKEE
jgi:hypothetical protein